MSFELITKTFRLNLRHPTQSIKCKVAQKWRRRLKTENHAELSSPFHAKTLKRKFEVEYTPLFNQSRKNKSSIRYIRCIKSKKCIRDRKI